MKKNGSISMRSLAVATGVLATMFLPSCQQSQQSRETPAKMSPAAVPSEKMFVVFEGPWAIAPDPKDSSKVLLIAPRTKSHRDLYVSASNNATLAAGIYDLSVPVSSTPSTPSIAPDIAQANISVADLQRILDTKSERYVIRLPKPEAYLAAGRFRSRVGPTYPPGASTEKEYATSVSLRYSVSGFNGLSLSGTPNEGSFTPKLMQVEANTVNFDITPSEALAPLLENCHVHTRQAFHDLTRLLNVTLYIDFPDSAASCRDRDPQKPSTTSRNNVPSYGNVPLSFEDGNPDVVQEASMFPRIRAVYLLFGHNPVICTGAVLMLSTR